MFIENQISEIFLDFAEIFETIRVNDYSDKQKDEMMQLFEGQTIKKCLDFIFSSAKFVKGIASVTDLVFNVVQKEKMSNFATKESFLEIFDKAVILNEETCRLQNVNDAFNGDLEHVDKIRELKKKNNDLRSESEVLHQEIEDKSSNLVETENLYIKLKYDYYKLTDQWEAINEENIILKKKFTVQTDLDGENSKVCQTLVEEIDFLKRIVEEKEAQISQLLVEERLHSESIELLKSEMEIKNRLLEEVKRESDYFKNPMLASDGDYPMQTQAVPKECKSRKCNEICQNLGMHAENDHGLNNVVHKLVIDERNSSTDDLKDIPFDVEVEFKGEEIKYSSTKKSLSEELLGAWTVLSDDDKMEHDDGPVEQYQEFFENPTFVKNHWKLDTINLFGDSGFHSIETNRSIDTKYYSCNMTSSSKEATDDEHALNNEAPCTMNDDERHEEDEKFFQSDINTKLRDIREQLLGLEKNLRERKRKVNRTLCASFLSIFYSCLQIFS